MGRKNTGKEASMSGYDDDRSAEENTAHALFAIAYQLKCLGNADAATPMGAMEALGAVLKEGFEGLAAAIHDHAEAIREAKE
jgi:hypothetical protein